MMIINYFGEMVDLYKQAVSSRTEVVWQKPETLFLEGIIKASP